MGKEGESKSKTETHEENSSCQRENKHINHWAMNSLQMKSSVYTSLTKVFTAQRDKEIIIILMKKENGGGKKGNTYKIN